MVIILKLQKIYDKKGSLRSLEFLNTYGWAMISLVLLLLVVSYIGIVNPDLIAPKKCEVPKGFDCVSYSIQEKGLVDVILNKNLNEDVNVVGFECSSQEEYTLITKESTLFDNKIVQPVPWNKPLKLSCQFLENPYSGKKGKMVDANFKLTLESHGEIKFVEGKIHVQAE